MDTNISIFFDMDGVLVDSELHWKTVESAFLKGLIPCWDEKCQEGIIGMSIYDVYELLAKQYNLGKSKLEFLGYYQDLAWEIYAKQASLLPGARDCIEQLAASGVALGLVSSSPRSWVEIVIKRFQLQEFFAATVSSDDVQGESKPSPAIYLAAARLIKQQPEICLAIEDSRKGVLSAKQAKMKCVGFRNGFNAHQDLSEADWEVRGFEELGSLLGF